MEGRSPGTNGSRGSGVTSITREVSGHTRVAAPTLKCPPQEQENALKDGSRVSPGKPWISGGAVLRFSQEFTCLLSFLKGQRRFLCFEGKATGEENGQF